MAELASARIDPTPCNDGSLGFVDKAGPETPRTTLLPRANREQFVGSSSAGWGVATEFSQGRAVDAGAFMADALTR